MTTTSPGPSATRQAAPLLGPYRVLDLTDERGELAGRILADLGADVVKVEPPGGDPSRMRPPFYQQHPDPERSLAWWASNALKRSVTLNLDCAEGQALFKRLVETADFVVESFKPGYLASLGLAYADLAAINPRIIVTSITPYGQTGPYRDYAASDLTLQAQGGFLYVNGDADRPPVRISADLAYRHAGGQGAAGSLVAHYHRQRTGRGQHVDVSMQDYIAWTPLDMTMAAQVQHLSLKRSAAGMRFHSPAASFRFRWRCKDGMLTFRALGSGAGQPQFVKLLAWMRECGFDDPVLTSKDWAGADLRTITQAEYDALADVIQAFLETKTVAELYARAVVDRLRLAPAASVRDIVTSPQIRAREALVDVEHPQLGTSFAYPGPVARFSNAPRVGLPPTTVHWRTYPAAASGRARLFRRRARGVASEGRDMSFDGVFSGLKIVDFTWAAAGRSPLATSRIMAPRSSRSNRWQHPDYAPRRRPFVDGVPGINRSGFFARSTRTSSASRST